MGTEFAMDAEFGLGAVGAGSRRWAAAVRDARGCAAGALDAPVGGRVELGHE